MFSFVYFWFFLCSAQGNICECLLWKKLCSVKYFKWFLGNNAAKWVSVRDWEMILGREFYCMLKFCALPGSGLSLWLRGSVIQRKNNTIQTKDNRKNNSGSSDSIDQLVIWDTGSVISLDKVFRMKIPFLLQPSFSVVWNARGGCSSLTLRVPKLCTFEEFVSWST